MDIAVETEGLQKGLIDRFRSLPMSRAAVLTGRTLADLVTNAFSLALMIAVGMAAGFRFSGRRWRSSAASR